LSDFQPARFAAELLHRSHKRRRNLLHSAFVVVACDEQKADKGSIDGQMVEHVATDADGLLRHYVAAAERIHIGHRVRIVIDNRGVASTRACIPPAT
jgi:hypothetical protein